VISGAHPARVVFRDERRGMKFTDTDGSDGNLMGFPFGRRIFIEGLAARRMCHGLRMDHERALNAVKIH
jgi:hypothetical protein